MTRTGWILFLLILIAGGSLRAQLPIFNMKDTTVALCKGILIDSEAGPGGIIYGNNEDFTFTIDAGGPVTLVFDQTFCTENGIDVLTFYDGPNTGSPQIGPAYSGTVAPPPIVANSGILTVHFFSDANVAYCGWEAQWTTDVPDPIPPIMSVPSSPNCNSNLINVQFSSNVHCDSIYTAAFEVFGIDPINVLSANATNCTGDSTTTAQLMIDVPFESNCPFDVEFALMIPDRCDSVWTFLLSTSGQVDTCPIEAEIVSTSDTLCAGTCTDLNALVDGCLTYTYTWDQGLPLGSGPHTVCPTVNTTYTVNVLELGTGNTSMASLTVVVIDPQLPMNDTTLCQSVPPFNIPGTPSGGYWLGPGITDTLLGVFDPDTAGPGVHYIHYTIGGLCSDSVQIEVEEMDAGLDEAACPGTAPFQVSGFAPMGGTWSGFFVTAGGIFDPSVPGSWVVTYSFGNCSDTKTINVANITGSGVTDTVCQSDWMFPIPANPYGGIWSGAGIIDTLEGVFDPDEAGGGLHNISYTLNGCADVFPIYVRAIEAGNNKTSCPSQSPFTLSPAATPTGGVWSGLGIIDPVNGIYDPWLANNGSNVNDTLTYTLPNGCVDTLVMYVRWTAIGVDTLFFCESDDWIDLIWATVQRTPSGGIWTGPGIVNPGGSNYDFYPNIAGVGQHILTYFINDCQDSILVIVYPDGLNANDTTICGSASPWVIDQVPQPAIIFGPGIPDPFTGEFFPNIAGPGVHTIYYWTPAFCIDSIEITVYPFQQASITGVDPVYCSNDIQVDINLDPSGGTFTGMADTLFNPSVIANGTYTLIYTVGTGDCITSDTVVFENNPPLQTDVTVSDTSICDGGGAQIVVNTSGGDPNAPPIFQWNNGLFPVNTQNVSPSQTTTYIVVTSDGCSEPVSDTIVIDVFNAFTPQFNLSEQQCYGDLGWVAGSVAGGGNFQYTWDTDPEQIGDSISASAGQSFGVNVLDLDNGCEYDTLIQIPTWPAITALFSTNPNDPCISFDESNVTFIDLSNNAITGEWNINGLITPYQVGFSPTYDLGSSGTYTAQLIVFNEGMCSDTLAIEVCILDDTPVFVPDAFSPNGDGNNDMLFVRGPGIVDMSFLIYDRWGSKVFESQHPDNGWDGRARGEDMPSGIYIYVLVARLNDGEKLELKGDITLVR